MDGYLKIKTKIDNKDVDKGITELENKIKKLQEDNSKSTIEEKGLQEEINKYKTLQEQANKYSQQIKELEQQKKTFLSQFNGMVPAEQIGPRDTLLSQIDSTRQKYAQITSEIDKQAPKIEKVYSKLDKMKTKQTENNTKIQQFKSKIESIKANNIKSSIDGIGKSITGQISKIGKMAMAVVGIRTAWSAVRSAVNLVSQYNPQISADLQYMGYCIANIVAPAVQWLTRLLYTALSYINAIMQAWFGINIFANSSVKAFKKMQSSAGGTAKSAKEIQKSLQGFDEMNILSDNSSPSSSGGGGGVATPSMDLSNMQGEIPEWLKWIIDNKDLILSVISGITTGLLAWKLGLDGIKSLGIGLLIAGIVYTIKSLIAYLNDGSWINFGKIIQGIGVALIGLGIIIASVPTAVVGAVVLIVGTIVKYWEQIKGFLQNGIDWLVSKTDWVRDNFGIVGETIYKIFTSLLQGLLNIFDSLFTAIKGIFDGIIKFVKGVFTGNWKQAWEGIKDIFFSVWNGIKGIVSSVWQFIKTILNSLVALVKGIVKIIWGAIKGLVNLIINGINVLIRGMNKLSFNAPDWVPGIGGKRWGVNIPQIPRLAKGGIISQPTQAIIGEAGREAVVPLENNMKWLDILANKLASKIGSNGGSYIINMDGRVIQRGIAKRQQELAFVRNGR